MNKTHTRFLVQQYLQGQLTEAQQDELLSIPESEMLEVLNELAEAETGEGIAIDLHQLQHSLQRVLAVDKPATKVVAMRSRRRWWVAAAVIALLGLATFMWQRKEPITPQPVAETPRVHDVQPGSNKAILTLADGRNIELNDASTGALAQQGNTSILKTDTTALTYVGSEGTEIAMYNTVRTPVSAQYSIVLSDGTKVWLNAMSSLRFPTKFDSVRTVEMTGEVYFEVAHNKDKPFIVKTQDHQIEVLGTRFNVNAYANEPAMKTSLLSGKVKVGNMVLAPGQAFMNGKTFATDIEQDLAWKNGIFNFQRTRLDKAMRDLERWYDIQVQYPASLAGIEFRGEMGKGLTLQQVLKGLEGMEGMHFQLTGKQLTISQ